MLLMREWYMHPNGQIPAYEWLRRRQPAGARLGRLSRLRREAEIRGEGDRVFLARVFDAADQLHLVGQPQGPRGPQPVPGRIPRPGQHRDLRRSSAAARRRPPRAGRRDRLDGPLLPVDAPIASAGPREPAYMDMALKFIAHFMWISGRDEPARGRPDAVGRPRRLLLRRDANAGRTTIELKVRSLVGLLPMCAATVFEPDVLDRYPRVRSCSRVHRPLSRTRCRSFGALPGASPEGRRITSLVDELACAGSSRSCSTRASSR